MKHNIQIKKTATYHTLGDPKTAKTIWIVFHGYGMLAEFFIKKFEPILDSTTCIIAPEGLSKFYITGFYGRVGATWMTKEDRTNEIEDYTNYLNDLYEHLLKENTSTDIKINVVGFSQGGATASRWVAKSKLSPDNFILWASTFPEELNFESFSKNLPTFVLFGNNDEFADVDYIRTQKALLKKSKGDFEWVEFEGTHNIPKKVLIEQTKKNNW